MKCINQIKHVKKAPHYYDVTDEILESWQIRVSYQTCLGVITGKPVLVCFGNYSHGVSSMHLEYIGTLCPYIRFEIGKILHFSCLTFRLLARRESESFSKQLSICHSQMVGSWWLLCIFTVLWCTGFPQARVGCPGGHRAIAGLRASSGLYLWENFPLPGPSWGYFGRFRELIQEDIIVQWWA